MCDAPYLVTQAYKAISGFSSTGGEFSYSFFFLVFLTTDKELLFRADPFSKNSKAASCKKAHSSLFPSHEQSLSPLEITAATQ